MVEKDDDAGARLLANKKLAGARLQFTPLSTLYQARDRGMWWRGSVAMAWLVFNCSDC